MSVPEQCKALVAGVGRCGVLPPLRHGAPTVAGLRTVGGNIRTVEEALHKYRVQSEGQLVIDSSNSVKKIFKES